MYVIVNVVGIYIAATLIKDRLNELHLDNTVNRTIVQSLCSDGIRIVCTLYLQGIT